MDSFFNYDRSIIRNSAVVVACYGRGQHTIAVATCVIADNIRVLVIPTADRWGAIITNDHVWFCSGGVAYRLDVVEAAICINNAMAIYSVKSKATILFDSTTILIGFSINQVAINAKYCLIL